MLSAFPLTPLVDDRVDVRAFAGLVERLAAACVDSITALGSTGSYAYLDRDERATVARTAVEHADGVPVLVGIGSLRTKHVLEFAEDAQGVGVSGVLLAPVSYQPLTEDEVFGLYADVCANISVPLVVYDNPRTTHFAFTDELHARIAELPNVASVKLPSGPDTSVIARLRALLPDHVTIGVSGDARAASWLNAGCDIWYSVIAGTLPDLAKEVVGGRDAGPLWDLFARYGGLRVVAVIAEELGLVTQPCLPRPILGLTGAARAEVVAVMREL